MSAVKLPAPPPPPPIPTVTSVASWAVFPPNCASFGDPFREIFGVLGLPFFRATFKACWAIKILGIWQHCFVREGESAGGSVPMPGWPEQDLAAFLANLLLSAVCLDSAIRTFQINRGAAAGFLLQALGPLLETAPLLAAPLGPSWQWAQPPDHAWACTVVGLPLLAFGFHWLNGDCFTANVLLGGALMLAGGRGCLTEEGKALAAHSVVSVVTVSIFTVSVFTGSRYGVVGSLLVGAAGLLAGTGLWPLPAPKERDALHCLMAAANLALCRALQAQHLELGGSRGEWLAAAAS